MPKRRIHLLGGLQVYSDTDQPIAIPGRKAQALLAYLARHPDRPQPRAKLGALLWEDSEQAQQRGSLRQALAVLRAAAGSAGGELLLGSADMVTLPSERAHIDAMEFERHAAEESLESLERATALYGGEFLEAFNPRAPAFEDWLAAERQHLRERAVQAMSRLLERHSEAGSIERAIEVALRLLALDPLQESVHRALMALYTRQGRRASALRQFHLCREVLRRDLDVAPEPETERVFREIQQQRRRRAEAAESAAPSSAPFPFGVSGNPPPLPELRQITAFCAEMADPAEEGCDPEAAQSLSERFIDMVRGTVEEHGGTVSVYVGGSAAAFFGLTVAHGNDAERAARAALQVREQAATLSAQGGHRPGVRIGIVDGTVLVTGRWAGGDRSPTGNVVNLAAKLAASARAEEILLSHPVRQTLWRLMEGEKASDIALPGAAGVVGAWRLTRLSDRPRRAARFIGRDAERRQFSGLLEGCMEHGRGLAVCVRGEPGIGKTRMVEAFQEISVEHGFVCHGEAVLDFGGSDKRDVIRTVARGLLGSGSGAEEEGEVIGQAVADGLLPGRLQPHLHDLLRLPQPVEIRAIYDAMDNAARARGRREALAELVRGASARNPRVIVIEDVHWADPSVLALSATLAATVAECPAILVMTVRPQGDLLNTSWRGMAGNSPLITMDLGPLQRQEALELAAEHAGRVDGFAARCAERSGGNPLFLEQLLRADPGTADSLPGSVQSVVLARMDRLAEGDRRQLRAASVFGQRFSIAALRHLTGVNNYVCDGLMEQGLVRSDGEEDFEFCHALLQEGAYSSLPGSERSALHRRAADWFTGRDPVLSAEHLDRAGDPGAPQSYLAAARDQARQYRYDHALRLVERGLAIGGNKADRFALACYRGELLHDQSEISAAGAAYEEAFALAGDDAERCRAWLGRATVKRMTDDLDGAFADVSQVERAAERLGLTEEAARAHFLHGNLLFPRGDIEGCLGEHLRSLELARQAGSPELEAAALGGLGDAEYMRGHMRSAHERFGQCVKLSERHGFGRIAVANRPMLANMLWYAGDLVGMYRETERSIEDAEKVGHLRAGMIAHTTAYVAQLTLLRLDRAMEHIGTALEITRRLGAPRFEAEMLAFRADIYRLTGRREKALDDLDRGLSIFRQTGMAYFGPWALGLLALAAKDVETRERLCRRASRC